MFRKSILKPIIIIIIQLFTLMNVFSQANVDSLLKLAESSDDVGKIAVFNKLVDAYVAIGDEESANKFVNLALIGSRQYNIPLEEGTALHNLGKLYKKKDYDKSMEYFFQAVNVRKKNNDFLGVNQSLVNIGQLFQFKGLLDSALNYYQEAYKYGGEAGYERGVGIAAMNIGDVYQYMGKYEYSVKYYKEALTIFEKINFTKGLATLLNNLAMVCQNNDEDKAAYEYWIKAYSYGKKLGDYVNMGHAHNNIGNTYTKSLERALARSPQLGKEELQYFDSAVYYYNSALESFTKVNFVIGIASANTNLGSIYIKTKDKEKAISYFAEALKITKEMNNVIEYCGTLQAAGEGYIRIGQYRKAIKLLKEGVDIAVDRKMYEFVTSFHRYLSAANDSLGNYKDAMYHNREYVRYMDSVRSQQTSRDLQVTVAQTRLKDQERITEQQKEINEQQKLLLIVAGIGLAIIIFFAILMLIQYNQKRKANKVLELQNIEISNQRNFIEEQQRGIMDSINYAKNIQNAILPQAEYMNALLNDYFVLFKPRDIVSGDFYWIGERDGYKIVCAADCTGHGVPGAFMSMLGTAFLNEINNTSDVINAAHILNMQRDYIITSLRQTGKKGEQKDGMDMALYIIDEKNQQIHFAGANNPLYILRDAPSELPVYSNNAVVPEFVEGFESTEKSLLIELKADKMPIGIYADKHDDFKEIIFEYFEGDSLYTFSDGFVDQFGGPNGKKFLSKRFKRVLADLRKKTMKEQGVKLDKVFEAWKMNENQIDDILVIGVRL